MSTQNIDENGEFLVRDYSDGRTKQSFKDDTDINKLLERSAKGDSLSHLAKHGAIYADFTDIDDLMTAHARLTRGIAIFNELPGEVRREFNQSPQAFFKYVNDPDNVDRLSEVLPGLAKRGNQMPQVNRTPEVMASVVEQTEENETVNEGTDAAE